MRNTNIEGFQLSPQQKHLWLLQQHGDDRVYRVQGSIVIEGNIDSEALKASLEDVVQRYEILNTTFHRMPGLSIPVQVINDGNGLLFPEHNWSDLGAQEQQAKIEALFRATKKAPFELDNVPLLKLTQVILAPTKRLLHISLPALCADATTISNLMQDICNAYDARVRGSAEFGEDETMQYADISGWQNELLNSEDSESGRAYWRKQNVTDVLNLKLPFEKVEEGKSGFDPQCLSLEVDSDIAAKIEQITNEHKVSTAVFFLTCWQLLLWRLTGQSDLIIGAACDGRTYEELQKTLGLLAKYLPLRFDLQENLRFTELLSQINELFDEMLEWQEYFSWDETGKSNNGVASPSFFPVCFSYETLPKVSLEDVSFAITQQYTCFDRFKIKLSCVQRDDALITEFHYDSNAIESAEVARLAGQFNVLLSGLVENPQAGIADFDVLTDAERKKIVVEFNATKGDYPKDKCIHNLIEEQARRTPDAMAVMFEDQKLSYAELDTRANKLASHLQKLGVGPEVFVGVYLEPSIELPVGLLGILKAGGAYVPLDPEYPPERLALILADTQAAVLLTQEKLEPSIPDGFQVVCLDSSWDRIAAESDMTPAGEVTPRNLAYAIYTSGSTGEPKGVPITHQNLVHSTHARISYYQEPVGRFLLLSSFAFDSSVVGLFWTLCSGGTLILPAAGTQRDPLSVTELIAHNRVTHLLSLPSLYGLLLSEAKGEELTSLKTVIVAGEACASDLIDMHNKLLPETALFNEYGPTEGTVWASVCDLRETPGAQVSIGRPIANAQIYLLNASMKPVPIGVSGELYIGGIGLTRGYLNRPNLTAEKFVPDVFSRESGGRLYRTGDFARYLPDGNIEFLGRADDQVKIRGYRVELGEIESALSMHRTVKENVVVATQDEPASTAEFGDTPSNKDISATPGVIRRLVAYIVPNHGEAPKVSELRSFLSESLPDFMVPAAFVFLETFPLMPNGKVDRKALPKPDRTRPDLEETFVAPRNPLEEVLTGIWAEVLDLEQVGIRDNFFELGGHSILVTRMVARIRDALQVELPLRTTFERPTVAGLSEVLLQDSAERERVEKMAELFVKVANLSDEQAEAMLEGKTSMQKEDQN